MVSPRVAIALVGPATAVTGAADQRFLFGHRVQYPEHYQGAQNFTGGIVNYLGSQDLLLRDFLPSVYQAQVFTGVPSEWGLQGQTLGFLPGGLCLSEPLRTATRTDSIHSLPSVGDLFDPNLPVPSYVGSFVVVPPSVGTALGTIGVPQPSLAKYHNWYEPSSLQVEVTDALDSSTNWQEVSAAPPLTSASSPYLWTDSSRVLHPYLLLHDYSADARSRSIGLLGGILLGAVVVTHNCPWFPTSARRHPGGSSLVAWSPANIV